MTIDHRQILRVSELARLELSPEERDELSRQLSEIINYVEKINEMDTAGVEPTDHIVELKNVFRADRVKSSIERSRIEKMAPEFSDGHIVVPRIIEEHE